MKLLCDVPFIEKPCLAGEPESTTEADSEMCPNSTAESANVEFCSEEALVQSGFGEFEAKAKRLSLETVRDSNEPQLGDCTATVTGVEARDFGEERRLPCDAPLSTASFWRVCDEAPTEAQRSGSGSCDGRADGLSK